MKPDLKVLLTSGYSDTPLAVNEAAREIKVLDKPYTREQLACALREALDGRLLSDSISLSQQSRETSKYRHRCRDCIRRSTE